MNLNETKLFVYGLGMIYKDEFVQKNLVFKAGNKHVTADFFDKSHDTDAPFGIDAEKYSFRKAFIDKYLPSDEFGDRKTYWKHHLPELFPSLEAFVGEILPKISMPNTPVQNVTFLEDDLNFKDFYLFGSNTSFEPVAILNSENVE
ncbi:hypothetical protein [Furfurilactobacillus milii]|uniref:hypothetical protein n=1 Tax=Furfurilactobacillus milii TaxID=2888272 RepID=UPI001F1A901D|nr:hypothetical protein [Furfurilactobacillus milii]MCF6419789.1 hypothetical protein [Furfurilactobacillus milii]